MKKNKNISVVNIESTKDNWDNISSELHDFCDKYNYTTKPLLTVMPMIIEYLDKNYHPPRSKLSKKIITKTLKVIKIDSNEIEFENGIKLYSNHEPDCCESHSLCLSDLTIDDFNDLEFDLTNDDFFKRIDGYGIELIPVKGHSVKIAGHGYNNGYYSSQLDLILTDGKEFTKTFDISKCQDIDG